MKHALTLFLIMLSGMAGAQDVSTGTKKARNFYLAASVGPAFPVGKFASADLSTDDEAGLAKTGYNLNLHAGYTLTKGFGLSSSIFMSRFKVDNDAVSRFLNGSGGSGVSATADHWQYWGIMAGPMGIIDVGDNVYLDVRALMGFARANLPVINFTLEGIPDLSAVTPDRWTDAFSWQIGTNLRYNFTDRACFFTNVDYNFMRPKWSYDVTENGSTRNVSIEQKMGVLDISLGVGVNL
jgi:hypothetical protein